MLNVGIINKVVFFSTNEALEMKKEKQEKLIGGEIY